MKNFDVIIIGSGAAGMMCAAQAGQGGLSVLLIDHAKKIGEKIRISGGGRCNFTNVNLDGFDGSQYFISQSPRFVRHALSRFHAQDFIQLITKYQIPYHEKHQGQLFCDDSAKDIIHMLQSECDIGKVTLQTACNVDSIQFQDPHYHVQTSQGMASSTALVIATGGLAAPAIGATAFGYEVAKQFGHSIVTPEAALVPLQFENWAQLGFADLSGLSLPVRISTSVGKKNMSFDEDLLFRHKGLSGPAILQISSYWQKGQHLVIDLCPDTNVSQALRQGKLGQKIQLSTALHQIAPNLPKRLLETWLNLPEYQAIASERWADIADHTLNQLGNSLNQWQVLPCGSDGHKKAEVTRGGVNVKEIDAKTMQSKLHNRLYFIGEVMDITGWLGGYNFQWAWSSAVCAAQDLIQQQAAQ